MDRRKLLTGLSAGALMLRAGAQKPFATRAPGTVRLLIGTSGRGSQGIYAAYFADGKLSGPVLVAEAANPSFLALPSPDSRVLFAVTQPESLPSHATSFQHPLSSDQAAAGQFAKISDAASGGPGGCHISATRDGRCVFVANYGGASFASFLASETGKLTLASHVDFPAAGHGPDAERQKQSYAHSALPSPDEGYVLVNDLGLDRIHIFKLDRMSAATTPHGEWIAAPGSGPRHLLVHPNGKWIYCIHELNSTIAQLEWSSSEGTLKLLGAPVSTLPEGVSARGKRACDMAFSRDHSTLYAANRIQESFAVFRINQKTGALLAVQHMPNPGKEARHIAVSPVGSYLLSANQFSDDISVHPIDPVTGELGERSYTVKLGGPSCLVFG